MKNILSFKKPEQKQDWINNNIKPLIIRESTSEKIKKIIRQDWTFYFTASDNT